MAIKSKDELKLIFEQDFEDLIDSYADKGSVAAVNVYTTTAALLADQGNQTEKGIYRVTDAKTNRWFEKGPTSSASEDDYTHGSIKVQYSGKNTIITDPAEYYNRKIKSLVVVANVALTSQIQLDPKIDGTDLLTDPIILGIGQRIWSSQLSNFSITAWNAWTNFTCAIPDANTNINIYVEFEERGDIQNIPLPQLLAPTLDSLAITSATSLTASWTDTNASPNEAGFELQHALDNTFASPTSIVVAQDSVSKTLTGLSAQEYFVRARGIGDGVITSDSNWSNILSATPSSATSILGTNTVLGTDTADTPYKRCLKVTPTGNGAIESMAVYHSGLGSGNLVIGVYSDNSGSPNALLATYEDVTNPNEGWQTVAFDTPLAISNGTPIWLSFVFTQRTYHRYNNTGDNSIGHTSTTFGDVNMDDPFGPGGQSPNDLSIYANVLYS